MDNKKEKMATLEEILKLVRELGYERKLKLLSRIVEDLSVKTGTKRPRTPITSYEFCGIWKDREDMKDGAKWVRELREKEESRSYHDV